MTTRIFTAKGDQGETDLLGERVGKDDLRIEAIGALDEATSAIGLGRAQAGATRTKTLLVETQRDLYQIMAELAFTDELRPADLHLSADRIGGLEQTIDELTAEVDLPPQFILPGDTTGGAALDLARTVVRRAERAAVALSHTGQLTNPEILRYLNRLSSLLFILARFEDRRANVTPLLAKESRRRLGGGTR